MEAGSKLNVVKVVNLKRFMPRMDVSQVFKKKKCFNNFNAQSPSCTENVEVNNKLLDDTNVKIKREPIEVPRDFEDCSNEHKTSFYNLLDKIRFKSCSHTDEELTKLTEHRDETLVAVGNVFESRVAFRDYINDHAKRWNYYYVCRTSKKTLLEYTCICMAYKLKPKANMMRRQKKRTTACPCKIRLAVDVDKKVIAYYVCNHHDHDLTETAFYNYPHAKYLHQVIKHVFLDLAYLGLEIDLIQKYIHSLVGLTLKRKDISSYVYKFKKKSLQRNLTAERKKYIKDLITTIRDAYRETMVITSQLISEEDSQKALGTKSNKLEHCKQRESQCNSKDDKNNALDTAIDDDVNINYEEPEDNILDDLLDSNVELNNYDVIVQYINEEGILCDQNGTPVTNSSAIMQFITNYEYVMPESNDKDEFLEEGTVFSELVENISDDIYPLDWDSVQEPKDVIEELEDKSSVEAIENVASADIEGATVDRELGPVRDKNSNNTSRITVLSNIVVNYDRRLSPTRASPAVYAEMDNFKKYYFVDHRYIKYEGENSNDQKQRMTKETLLNRERMTKWAIAHGEEYIKAPESKHFSKPLRKCFGHDRLTLLSDPDAILPGAKFLTHEVFLKYINERANRWFFYYSLVESGKMPFEFYVYKCVFGKHRASKNAYRAKGLRKRAKLTTQCPCQIRLRRLYMDPTYLTVLYSCNHHDHTLDAQLFKAQPHSRRLPGHIKEEIKDLLSLGAKFDLLGKYVTSETGVRVYGKYFHNVRVKMTRDNESRHFTEERFAALTQKLKDLEAAYGSASKENPQFGTVHEQVEERLLPSSHVEMEDQSVQVGLEEVATQTQEYYQLDNIDEIAEKTCVVLTDSTQPPSRKHGRLETRLKNLSSHEETLLKVKKLQESVRSDNLRNTYEVIQYNSTV